MFAHKLLTGANIMDILKSKRSHSQADNGIYTMKIASWEIIMDENSNEKEKLSIIKPLY